MDASSFIQSATVLRKSVTIPATGGTADTLASLASLTASEKANNIAVKVMALDTAGASRAAFLCGDSVGTQLQYIAAGTAYYEPACRDAVTTYVKSAATAISNVCVVFYQGVNPG